MCCLSLCVSVCLSLWLSVCAPILFHHFPHSARHFFFFAFRASCFFACFLLCALIRHLLWIAFCLFLNVCFKCMFLWVFQMSLSIYVRASLSLCLFSSLSVFSSCRCLHNVPSSSLCDFAERGPGSGCHPLPPSQHCPGTPDQRHSAAHRLPALPHQPAPHLHRPTVWGAGALLWKHRALLPGVQRADGSLQRIWVCWIHEEGLCFSGPVWAAGPTAGMLQSKWLFYILNCI